MQHLDLFSGIGGFAYAVDQVWPDSTHVFCDNNKFCQKVLAKHWPESKIYGDIKDITEELLFTNTNGGESGRIYQQSREKESEIRCDIVTGGFPCQPFSIAGKRKGTADDRYLWPEMLRVIRIANPTWVIAENVRGILSQEQGMVFEQVCLDLENEGYQVQPIVIPACAVNAPHRRDRVWFIAHANNKRLQGYREEYELRSIGEEAQTGGENWSEEWTEVAARFCRVDDGIPNRVDRLRALGNAIVPQVAIEIMKAIALAERSNESK